MAVVTVTGAVQAGHVGITSDDPNNPTGRRSTLNRPEVSMVFHRAADEFS